MKSSEDINKKYPWGYEHKKPCEKCGKDFWGFPNSQYCTACKELVRKENARKYHENKKIPK